MPTYDMMTAMIIANIVGVLLFLFLLWRRLKEDYITDRVFGLGFTVIISTTFGYFLSFYLLPNYWFWSSLLFGFIGYLITIFRFNMKFFETFDTLVVAYLPWLSAIYIADAVSSFSLLSFVAFWVTLVFIFIYFLINNFYKSFVWYKSGRVGFAGVSTLLLFFLARGIISAFIPTLVSFSGSLEVYLSSTIVFACLVLIFILSKPIK